MRARLWLLGAMMTAAPAWGATLTLDWDAVTQNADATPITDLAGYHVFYRASLLPGTTSAAMSDGTVTKVSLGNVLTYTVNTLQDGTSYYFRVTARDNAANHSAFSLNLLDQDVDESTFTAAPAAPINVAATALSHQQVRFTWRDNSGGEAGFRIERSSPDNTAYALVLTTSASAGTGTLRTFTDPAVLTPQTTYYYRVRAQGGSVHSSFVEAFAVTPAAPATAPAQPTNFRVASATNTQISLAWADASSNETAFELQWSPTGTGSWTSLPSQAANTQAYDHAPLTAGTSYYYRIRAVNGAGSPAYSAALLGRTTGGAAPGGLAPPPGLKQAYAFPNPAVGQDPVIRAMMGGVDLVEVTIFDQAGRAVHSGRTTSTRNVNGETAYEYVWTGEKATGVYYAVIHGRKGDEVVRARAKFAVVR